MSKSLRKSSISISRSSLRDKLPDLRSISNHYGFSIRLPVTVDAISTTTDHLNPTPAVSKSNDRISYVRFHSSSITLSSLSYLLTTNHNNPQPRRSHLVTQPSKTPASNIHESAAPFSSRSHIPKHNTQPSSPRPVPKPLGVRTNAASKITGRSPASCAPGQALGNEDDIAMFFRNSILFLLPLIDSIKRLRGLAGAGRRLDDLPR